MKIVQIFPGKVWGGAEQYVLDLGRALEAEGHRVEYMCRRAQAVTSRLDSQQTPYTIVDSDSLERAAARCDIIHIHDGRFVKLADRAIRRSGSRARTVLTRHIARASRVMPWLRGSYRRLGAMIFVSEFSKRMWHDVNRWMPDEKCAVVHNSIPLLPADNDQDGKQTESLRTRFGIDPTTPMLMFTGRVRRSKGCEIIIEALAKIPEPYAMVFVGAPKPADYDRTLLDLARRKGIAEKIHFHGFTPDARMLVAQADIGVQPSIVKEAFGLSMLEFMQAGKPVITTSNGAQPEYITDGKTGILVPADDPDHLAAAIEDLIRDPGLRHEIGERAADHYSAGLSYPKFVNSILNVYAKAVNHDK